MAYVNRWLVQDRVALVEFTGDISIDDLQSNDADMLRYVSSGTAPVHIVCKLTNMGKFPSNIATISQSANQYLRHPSMGWFLVLGINNPFLGFIGKVVANISQLKFKQVDDAADLRVLLARVDATLDDATLDVIAEGV